MFDFDHVNQFVQLFDNLIHHGSSPLTTMVMREQSGISQTPTARLSMLKLRRLNNPETLANSPGRLWTSTDKVC
jgi:hypothetical protein